jgi:hypothetical protein
MVILIFDRGGRLYVYRSFKKIKQAGHSISAYVLVFDKGVLIDEGGLDVFINI